MYGLAKCTYFIPNDYDVLFSIGGKKAFTLSREVSNIMTENEMRQLADFIFTMINENKVLNGKRKDS